MLKNLSLFELIALDNYKEKIIKVEPDIYINILFGITVFINDIVKEKIEQNGIEMVYSKGVISIPYFSGNGDYLPDYYCIEQIYDTIHDNKISLSYDLYHILFSSDFDVLVSHQ